MVTDRLSDVEVENAGALRRRLLVDGASAEIFNGLARLVARVLSAPAVVLAFGDAEAPWIEFRFDASYGRGRAIATVPLVSSAGARLGELRLLDRGARLLEPAQSALLAEFATLVVRNFEARIEVLREREIERYRLEVLKLTANDAPLQQIFDSLIASVEYSIPGSICTIMTLSERRLYGASYSRSMPASYMAAIEGAAIGPEEGSCGAAAFLGETVIVADIRSDPLWRNYKSLASAAALESCWSTPIVNSENEVLGTLAIYRRYPSAPSASILQFTHEAAHVAAISIEASKKRIRLEQMALHDSLTKLPNRALFENRMEQAIASARRTGRCVAIGLMDLNRFKIVNDSLGHAVGDQLLTEVAARLSQVVRPQDTVARMGGDEFLLLMADLESGAAARSIAERFASTLAPSFTLDGNEVFVQGSMGVSVYPDDSGEPKELLRFADGAMYTAKASGDRVAFYQGSSYTHSYSFSRLDIETSLYAALAKGEFEMLFQPQVAVTSGAIRAAEGLLRWRHARFGVMEPERFMTIAEDTGLSIPIGAWVLQEACRFGRRWADSGGRGNVWVNVSPRQIEDARFVATVTAALESSGLPASKLWLEITEGLIMRMPENAAAKLADLRALGVRTAIDDFGRGYSSLSYLKRLPIGAIKIDPDLLREVALGTGTADEAIVRAILGVGRSLGIKIVAEGVETELQRDFLRRNGCTLAQGFYFAQPMTADDVLRWKPAR